MRSFVIFSIILCVAGCNPKNDYKVVLKDPLLYSKTVHELNTVVMGNNFSPIVASRNYLYANIAAYEVMSAAYPKAYASLAGQVRGLDKLPVPTNADKISFEFAALLAFCRLGESVTFPEGSMADYVDGIKDLAKKNGMSRKYLIILLYLLTA
jgi:hypothetical protein